MCLKHSCLLKYLQHLHVLDLSQPSSFYITFHLTLPVHLSISVTDSRSLLSKGRIFDVKLPFNPTRPSEGGGYHGWHVLKAELMLGLAVPRAHQVALPAYWHPAKYLTLFSSLNGICYSADQGYRSNSSLNAFQVFLLNLNNQMAGEETETRELPGDCNFGWSFPLDFANTRDCITCPITLP